MESKEGISPCWRRASEMFQAELLQQKKPPDRAEIAKFLAFNVPGGFDKMLDICQSFKTDADNMWKGKSEPVGRFLRILQTVQSVADPFLQSAPESVSVVWWAITMIVQVAKKDIQRCNLVASASETITFVVLNCRLYEKKYGYHREGVGDDYVEAKIFEMIPTILASILHFAWYTHTKFLVRSKLERIFSDVFSTTLQEKVETITNNYEKLKNISGAAFESRVMDQLEKTDQDLTEIKSLLGSGLEGTTSALREFIAAQSKREIEKKYEDNFRLLQDYFIPQIDSRKNFDAIIEDIGNYDREKLCQWFFDKEDYKIWRDLKQRYGHKVLWLEGPQGYGKSTVLACSISRLQDPAHDPDSTELHVEHVSPIVLQFFYSRGGSTKNFLSCLETMISGLLSNRYVKDLDTKRKVLHIFHNLARSSQQGDESTSLEEDEDRQESDIDWSSYLSNQKGDSSASRRFSASSLMNAIHRIARLFNRPIFFVIDAVDEAPDWIAEASSYDSQLEDLADSEIANIRVLVSRTDPLKSDALSDYSATITLTPADTIDDMRSYLRNKLRIIMKRRIRGDAEVVESELDRAVDTVAAKAKGSFKYAAAVLSNVDQLYPGTFQSMLESLPDEMDDLYKSALNSLTPAQRDIIVLALTWSVFSRSKVPLRIIAEQYKGIYETTFVELPNSENEKDAEAIKKAEDYRSSLDAEVEDVMYHLPIIGRTFFRTDFNTEYILLEPSVKQWVEREAEKAAKWQKQEFRLGDVFSRNSQGQWKFAIDIPVLLSSGGNGNVIIPSAKDACLDIAIKIMRTMNHKLFQERYLVLESNEELSRDSKAQIGKVSTTVGQNSDENKERKIESNLENGAEAEPEAVVVTKTTSVDETRPKPPKANRYEIQGWMSQLNYLQDLWKEDGERVGPRWDELWKLVRTFIRPEMYKRWRFNFESEVFGRKEAIEGILSQKGQPSLLHHAVDDGIFILVKFLIEEYDADIAFIDWYGHTCLHVEDAGCYPDIVQYVLDKAKDPKSLLHHQDTEGKTVLFNNVQMMDDDEEDYQSRFKTTEILLKNGSDPDCQPFNGDCAVWYCYDRPDLVQLFMKYGANFNISVPKTLSTTPTCLLMASSFISATTKVIDPMKNARDSFLKEQKRREKLWAVCKLLVEAGVDLTAAERYGGYTCLHFAAYSCHREYVQLLAQKAKEGKIDINCESYAKLTPLQCALNIGDGNDSYIYGLHVREIVKIFIDAGADLNHQTSDSIGPLYYAVRYNLLEVTRMLVEHGADVNDDDIGGCTALHAATVVESSYELVKLLLDHGANIFKRTTEGLTPFTYGLRYGVANVKTTEFLFAEMKAREVAAQSDPTGISGEPEKEEIAGGPVKGPTLGSRSFIFDRVLNNKTIFNICALHRTYGAELAKRLVTEMSQTEVQELLSERTQPKEETALHDAASVGNYDMIDFLLHHGVDANIRSTEHESPLMIALKRWPVPPPGELQIDWIESQISWERVILRLAQNTTLSDQDKMAFVFAAANHRSKQVWAAMPEYNINPTGVDSHGWNVFQLVRVNGDKDQEKTLRENYPDHDIEALLAHQTQGPTRLVIPDNPERYEHHWYYRKLLGSDYYKLSQDGLELSFEQVDEVMPLMADHPVPLPGPNFYFEITILEGNKYAKEYDRSLFAIGLASYPYLKGDRLGADEDTLALVIDLGYKYICNPDQRSFESVDVDEEDEIDLSWEIGDTFGLGYNRRRQEVYFTRNYTYLGARFRGVTGMLWPAVHITPFGKLKVNFAGPFVYQPNEVKKKVRRARTSG